MVVGLVVSADLHFFGKFVGCGGRPESTYNFFRQSRTLLPMLSFMHVAHEIFYYSLIDARQTGKGNDWK